MLLTILILIAILFVIFVIIVALQPANFCITRSATMSASPPIVFEQVNDFHKWAAWSPWLEMDPTCKNTFSGAPAGEGAIFTWDGNKQVGAGRMTLTKSRPSDLILIKLEFFKPFKAINKTEFTFKGEGSQTVVTWSMSGKNNFMGKAMGLVMNCDKMVGGQFERGLRKIKSIVEVGATP